VCGNSTALVRVIIFLHGEVEEEAGGPEHVRNDDCRLRKL